ncbi:FkbM family methyltransferase [Ferruginibacter sp.]|uniref:FkbM family methyltransferase n=1 Tax=Ferruginibacter sp. TaxID=1940288 RepID=UPI0019B6E871|nr:FkbM family methyltransferase [Ferruginibacter sp.]MBC7629032.1 FkbM family methyltransferase [Ferruginibacter sp.]
MKLIKYIKKKILNQLNQNDLYEKDYLPLGISKNDFIDYVDKKILYNSALDITSFLGKKIKRINSYSFVHSVEGIFLEELYKFDSDLLSPHIIDCGANIGLSAIYFKKLYPNSKLIAFEPDKKVFEACQYNLNQFGFSDVKLINAGVWNYDGSLNFLPDNSLGGRIVEDDQSGKNYYSIKVVDFKKYLNVEVDFLKIDIEGAELDVLKNCRNELKFVKRIFVEYHSDKNKPQDLQELLSILTAAGFRYYIKEAWDYLDHPYSNEKNLSTFAPFDLQLNIFGYRKDFK